MRGIVCVLLFSRLLSACEADGLIWMPTNDAADPFFRIVIGERAGFIDKKGRLVIKPTLEVESNWGQTFSGGLLQLGSSTGPFLDVKGTKVLDLGFDGIWEFSEGLAVADDRPQYRQSYCPDGARSDLQMAVHRQNRPGDCKPGVRRNNGIPRRTRGSARSRALGVH